MSDTTEAQAPTPLRPLKTWSHLAGQRRRPSEYEIVSTKLLWHRRGSENIWEVGGPQGFMAEWYAQYRDNSPVQHEDWDQFRDPDEMVYRTYNILQDGQETYVDGLLEQYSGENHDAGLSDAWVTTLARLYTPGRYLLHTVQMASSYLVHIPPASTIGNCAAFQAADALRWVSRTAYRTKELALAHPGAGFGKDERRMWEELPAWQGFRELMEKALVTYDWAEAFLALNVVAKPAIDEAWLRQFAASARRSGDTLLGLLADAALRDSERSRRWTAALVEMMLLPGNQDVLETWLSKWIPLGEAAVSAFCAELPENPEAAEAAVERLRAFRSQLGFKE
jgi:toluene monooxygenase system protein E